MTERTERQQTPKTEDRLAFCTNCHVSIAQTEFDMGTARRTSQGSVWCTLCARAGKAGRDRRRAALEEEFADDAPIIAPAAAPPRHGPTLEMRVGHLERTVFQLQARVEELEVRLADRRDA